MDKDKFMTAVKQKFTNLTSQTRLAQYAFRFDIQHEKKFIKRLKKLAKDLEKLKRKFEKILGNINKKYKELLEIVEKFKHIIKESEEDIEGAFQAAYKIKKRDFSMMLTILVNAEVLERMDKKWIRMHFLPELPTEEKIKKIDDIKEKLGEKLHVAAQALRISISAEENLEKEAMPLLRT